MVHHIPYTNRGDHTPFGLDLWNDFSIIKIWIADGLQRVTLEYDDDKTLQKDYDKLKKLIGGDMRK